LPADTDSDDWNILAKNPSHNWKTGEPANNIEYVRADLLATAGGEGNAPAESLIRNQAGSIIYDIFGPQHVRRNPPSRLVVQLGQLQDRITTALLAAHRATVATPAPAAAVADWNIKPTPELLDNWPVQDVLRLLAEWATHLLSYHNCDAHGYEGLQHAVVAARAHVETMPVPAADYKCAGLPDCKVLEGSIMEFFVHDKRCPASNRPAGLHDVVAPAAECVRQRLKPEAWHCQKCAGALKYEDEGVPIYVCDKCQMIWPASSIVQFGYADLTDEMFSDIITAPAADTQASDTAELADLRERYEFYKEYERPVVAKDYKRLLDLCGKLMGSQL
jgi:hypothetical protein